MTCFKLQFDCVCLNALLKQFSSADGESFSVWALIFRSLINGDWLVLMHSGWQESTRIHRIKNIRKSFSSRRKQVEVSTGSLKSTFSRGPPYETPYRQILPDSGMAYKSIYFTVLWWVNFLLHIKSRKPNPAIPYMLKIKILQIFHIFYISGLTNSLPCLSLW